jgi:type II secretory ATPase GspE/PulE/Tfp pilus assembly ATPase PilB-like protein
LRNLNGLLLVTGPAGEVVRQQCLWTLCERNLRGYITVEKPAEADINGIHPVVVKEKAGLTFIGMLRCYICGIMAKGQEGCVGTSLTAYRFVSFVPCIE